MAERVSGAPAEGKAMRTEHIQRSRVGSYSAALLAWAAGKFTDGQAAAMRAVGIEMLNTPGGPRRAARSASKLSPTLPASASGRRATRSILPTRSASSPPSTSEVPTTYASARPIGCRRFASALTDPNKRLRRSDEGTP